MQPGATNQPREGDALIVVDVQNDFLPGGNLAVPDGDQVIPVLNRIIEIFEERSLPVFATRDWHPADHLSFKEQGGTWPPHCVQGTQGAAFSPDLVLPAYTALVSKASTRDQEAYSGFQGTDLHKRLRKLGVRRLFIGGLATDYCVLNTVRDALELGYQVFWLRDASRAVNVAPKDGRRAEEEMIRRGARPVRVGDLS